MIKVDKFLLHENATIRDAISVIDKGAAQVALVVDCNRKLKGIITDGDIRRAILSGNSLESYAKTIMSSSPITLNESGSREMAFEIMQRNTLHHLPIVDCEGCIVDIEIFDNFIKSRKLSNPVVIMAGGKGERLGSITNKCPKPMLEINGKPILETILGKCIEAGFTKFFISVNYLKENIINHFGSGDKWGVQISYLEEEEPLGTCGSLKLLPREIQNDLLILNGDIITNLKFDRLIAFHKKSRKPMTVCSRSHPVSIPFGVIESSDSRVINFFEKPTYNLQVNAGVYVVNPVLIKEIPDSFYQMDDFIDDLIGMGIDIGVFPIHENWNDIGRPNDLLKLVVADRL